MTSYLKTFIAVALLALVFFSSCKSYENYAVASLNIDGSQGLAGENIDGIVPDYTHTETPYSDKDNISIYFQAKVESIDNLSFPVSPNTEIARAMDDGNEWGYVNQAGDILPYDYMRGFEVDSLFCIVEKNGKYGVINAEFDIMIPVEYSNIVRAYKQHPDSNAEFTDWILYAEKDEQWFSIDLHKGIIVTFDINEISLDRGYLYSDFDVVIHNNKLLHFEYFGEQIDFDIEMFVPAFDNQKFTILNSVNLLPTEATGSLIKGDFQDEIKFIFDDIGVNQFAYTGVFEPCGNEIDISSIIEGDTDLYEIIFSTLNRNNKIGIVYLYYHISHIWATYIQL